MKVDVSTAHDVKVISRRWAIVLAASHKIVMALVGIGIAVVIYTECLHDKDCHPVAVAFFALLSLTCFYSAGLPVDKLVNAELVKKSQ
jgi:hypothetical protein